MVPSVYRTGDASLTAGTLPPGFTGPCLISTNYLVAGTTLFETNTPGFPLPHFGLLTTNRLQVFILDFTNNSYHVIDYAHLEQMTSRDLNAEIFTDGLDGIWNTNYDSAAGLPYGIENQIRISKGFAGVPKKTALGRATRKRCSMAPLPTVQQASFQAFFAPYGFVATAPGW